jgi:hypothetical protein
MTATKVPLTGAIQAVKWIVSGDDAEAATETRKRAKLCGPDAIALLHYVLTSDKFASPAQRVRAATVLLEVGEFTSSEAKPTGLFHDPEGASGAAEREAS